MHRIKARIVGPKEELGTFDAITVHGCELSREFSEHEVDDFVFGKLKGNRHVEVLIPKSGARKAADEDASASAPQAKEPVSEA